MKIKDLVSIILRIIGLVAFWKSIQAFGSMLSGIGVLISMFLNNHHVNNSFMIIIGTAMVLNFILPLAVAIIFIFRTERVLSIIKIKEQDQIYLNLDKHLLYHIVMIVFGFMIIMHGSGNFLEFNLKTDTKTEYITKNISNKNQSPNISKEEKVFVTHSKSKNINYFALIEIVFGVVLLTKAADISKKIENNFTSKRTN